jgi:hypothetical protein
MGEKPFTLTVDLEYPRIVVSLRDGHVRNSSAFAGNEMDSRRLSTRRLAALGKSSARSLLPSVLALLHQWGFRIGKLEQRRRGRLRLAEDLGARIVLLLWTLAPIQKPSRAALVRAGITTMAEEEVYYWYAKAEGGPSEAVKQRRQNTLKALRILLAGE